MCLDKTEIGRQIGAVQTLLDQWDEELAEPRSKDLDLPVKLEASLGSAFTQRHFTCSLEELGIEPPTSQLVDALPD